jgi:hypothetical protein
MSLNDEFLRASLYVYSDIHAYDENGLQIKEQVKFLLNGIFFFFFFFGSSDLIKREVLTQKLFSDSQDSGSVLC